MLRTDIPDEQDEPGPILALQKASGEAPHVKARGALFGTSVMAAASAFRMAVQTLVLPVTGRLLGPEVLGQLALVAPIIYFAMLFAESGLGACLLRADTVTRALEGSVFGFAMAVTLIIMAAFCVVAFPLGYLFHEPQFPLLLLGMSSIMVLAALNIVPASLLLRDQRYDVIAMSDTVSVFCGVGALALGIVAGWGVWSLVAQQATIWFCKFAVLYYASRWRPKFDFDWPTLKPNLAFGLSLTGSSLIAFIARNIDNVLIGSMLGETILGYYTVAFQIVCLPQVVLSGSVYFAVFTRVSEAQRLATTSSRLFLQALRGTLLLSTPMIAGLAAVSHDAVPLFLGENWRPAAPVLTLLAPFGLCQSVWPCLSAVIGGQGRAKLTLRMTAISGSLTIVGIAATVGFGSLAVATSVSATAVLGLGLGLWHVIRIYGLPWASVARCFMPPTVSSLIMVTSLSVLRTYTDLISPLGLSLVVQIIAGFMIYVSSLVVLFPGHIREDVLMVRNLMAAHLQRARN